jgi:outer membrane receptor for ferrienterochelin and colicins
MDNFLFMPAEFTTGIEYIDNKLNDEMLGYDRFLKQRAQSLGGYFQNEWRNERFSLSLGARLDRHNLMDRAVLSPRANTRYRLNENITLRASYSSGYRAPQIFDEDLHVAAVGGEVSLITVDPDLKPEYSNSFNFSIDLDKNFGKVATNLLIDGFYTDLRNVFVLEEMGQDENNNFLFERTNALGAVVQGINFDLTMGLSAKFFANAGFTIQRSRYKEPYEWSPDVEPEKQMLRAPNHYGYITLSYTPVRRLTFSATGIYTGPMLVPHLAGDIEHDRNFTTPSFFDAGLRFSYEFRLSTLLRLQVNGGVRNIFNQFQRELDSGPLRDSGFVYGPSLPRMVSFGVRFLM